MKKAVRILVPVLVLLFLYVPMNKTYAEMNQEEKNQVSHRFRAAQKMREIMEQLQD